jgi:3-hydroxybutyrate dehydrogenase
MKESDVRRRAFAMPLTNPAYPIGPYRFYNREFLIITYRTDPQKLRGLVPEPLQVDEPLVKFEFIRMPDSTGFGDYTESGQVIPVSFQGRKGGYSHCMFLDDHPPIAGGRELWGFPKKLAKPTLRAEIDTLVGTLDYGPVRIATGTMGYKHKALDQAVVTESLLTPNFLLKIMPHVDGTPRVCELVEYYLLDVDLKGAWTGPAALTLFSHALAPLAELPVLEVVSGDPHHRRPHARSRQGRARLSGLSRSIHGNTGVLMRLQDKVAIVTGAASGIGKGIATLFVREGAKVAIADLNQKAADAVARELDATGKRAIGVAMDVSEERQVEAGTAKVIDTFGALDVLVSNAGIQIVAPLVDFEFAKWKQLLAIHLDGAFLTTRAALRQMYKQKRGSVIYMGSVHSKEASVLKAPYVTAKHGLIGLAKVVAKEGAAHGVRANVICPGFVRTPLVDKQIPEQSKELGISEEDVIKKVMLKDTVDGEFTTVQDVAETALFLASFQSNALTGQSIVVSHGWSMQ